MPLKLGNLLLAKLYETHLTSHAGLVCVPLSRQLLIQAAHLRAELNMKLPNAIHVASALLLDCDSLLTNDQGMRTPENLRVFQLNEFLLG